MKIPKFRKIKVVGVSVFFIGFIVIIAAEGSFPKFLSFVVICSNPFVHSFSCVMNQNNESKRSWWFWCLRTNSNILIPTDLNFIHNCEYGRDYKIIFNWLDIVWLHRNKDKYVVLPSWTKWKANFRNHFSFVHLKQRTWRSSVMTHHSENWRLFNEICM